MKTNEPVDLIALLAEVEAERAKADAETDAWCDAEYKKMMKARYAQAKRKEII